MTVRVSVVVVVGLSIFAGCGVSDPIYLTPAEALEVGMPGSDVALAETQIVLPVRLEEDDEREEREALEAELGVMVPYVTRADIELSLEWSLRNLNLEEPAQARIHINGANEYFAYVPASFVVDPDEEEVPPPLAGDIPILLEPGETVSGVFREDDLLEAALDLELITRGGLNPFAAMLEIHEDLEDVEGADPAIPLSASGHLIRLDLALLGNRHLVLEYAVRVRDRRRPRLIHERGLAADPGELTAFAPADFTPPPPVDP